MQDRKIQAWTNPSEHVNNYLIGSLVSHTLHSFYMNGGDKPQEEFNEFWRMTKA